MVVIVDLMHLNRQGTTSKNEASEIAPKSPITVIEADGECNLVSVV